MQRGERHGKTMISRALHVDFNLYSTFLFRHHCTNYNNNTCNVIRWSSRSRMFKAHFLLLSLYRGFRNLQPENFCLSNPESWALESGNPLMILESGIHVPLTKNPEPSAWNLESLTWNLKSKTIFHFQTWQFSRCRRIFPPCQKLKNTVKRSI